MCDNFLFTWSKKVISTRTSIPGAIFGSLEILADRSVTREKYIQDKKIPDWSSCENRTFDMVPLLDEPSPLRPVLSRRQTSGITSTLSSLSSALSSRILVGGPGRLSPSQGIGSSSRTSTKSGIIKESAAETKKDSSSDWQWNVQTTKPTSLKWMSNLISRAAWLAQW